MQQLKDKLDDDMEVGYFLYHGTSLRETLDDLSARAKREKEDAFANGAKAAQAADTALITENATLRLQVAHFTRIIQSAQATHPLQSQSTMSLAQVTSRSLLQPNPFAMPSRTRSSMAFCLQMECHCAGP